MKKSENIFKDNGISNWNEFNGLVTENSNNQYILSLLFSIVLDSMKTAGIVVGLLKVVWK